MPRSRFELTTSEYATGEGEYILNSDKAKREIVSSQAIGLLFLLIGRPAILCIDRPPYSLSSDKAKRDFALGQLEQGHFEARLSAGKLPKTCSFIR